MKFFIIGLIIGLIGNYYITKYVANDAFYRGCHAALIRSEEMADFTKDEQDVREYYVKKECTYLTERFK